MKKKVLKGIATLGLAGAILVGCTEETEIKDSVEQEKTEVSTADKKTPEVKVELTDEQEEVYEALKEYLDEEVYSRMSLRDIITDNGVEQVYDFKDEDVEFVINNLDVDWEVKATATALSYLEHGYYSEQGLINQVMFEFFTEEEATKAVQGLDILWEEKAKGYVKELVEKSGLSEEEIKDQLINEEHFIEEHVTKAFEALK